MAEDEDDWQEKERRRGLLKDFIVVGCKTYVQGRRGGGDYVDFISHHNSLEGARRAVGSLLKENEEYVLDENISVFSRVALTAKITTRKVRVDVKSQTA